MKITPLVGPNSKIDNPDNMYEATRKHQAKKREVLIKILNYKPETLTEMFKGVNWDEVVSKIKQTTFER